MQISNRTGLGKLLAAVAAIVLFHGAPARADGVDATEVPAAASGNGAKISDSFEIGVEGTYYQYREPDFAKLQGYGFGLEATYTYNWRNYFLKANAIGDYYDLNYSSNGTGSDNGIADYKGDFRGLFGYNFHFNKKMTLSPYVGLGYRILFDAEGEKITNVGASGYDRRSQYFYAPIGTGFGFHVGNWGLSTFGEFDYLIQGYQTSYLSDDGFDNNLSNTQNSGYGIRGNFLVTPPIDFFDFTFGPYARYWHIDASDFQPLYQGGVQVGTGQEPNNNTLEVGLEATLTFH